MRLRKNGSRAEPQPELKATKRMVEGERLATAEDAERTRRAELSQLEVEAADLRERLESIEEQLALTRLGEGDPEALTRERDEVEVRLAEVCCAIDDARRAAGPLQRALAEAKLEQARDVAASSAAAVDPARARVEQHEATLQSASRNLAELEREAAQDREAVRAAEEELEVVAAGLAEGEEDPLASYRERAEKAARARVRQRDELVRWHVQQVRAMGTGDHMKRVAADLRDEVERRVAEEDARDARRTRELAEQAEAERAARSGQSQGRVPGEVVPGEPFLRVG